jgi:hypothetical protein
MDLPCFEEFLFIGLGSVLNIVTDRSYGLVLILILSWKDLVQVWVSRT